LAVKKDDSCLNVFQPHQILAVTALPSTLNMSAR